MAERVTDHHDITMGAAWLTAALSRGRSIPPMHDFLLRKRAPTVQSEAENHAVMTEFVARFKDA